MVETILLALSTFVIANKSAIAAGVVSSASYDVIKGSVNISKLQKQVSRFFKSDEQTDDYLKTLCEKKASNPHKPERDLEDEYEAIAQQKYDPQLFEEIKSWIQNNEDELVKHYMNLENQSGFNIGVQNSRKNIFNIGGDYKPKKEK
jgi:hypothetical protein